VVVVDHVPVRGLDVACAIICWRRLRNLSLW
jgi:hypothetical protein